MENQTIGKNIKAFRERQGLNQEDLAGYLGIKREVISYYENGTRNPPVDKLRKLADIFGIDEDDLLEENPDAKEANVAFAFRTDGLKAEDLQNIARFRKIVKNYLSLVKLIK